MSWDESDELDDLPSRRRGKPLPVKTRPGESGGGRSNKGGKGSKGKSSGGSWLRALGRLLVMLLVLALVAGGSHVGWKFGRKLVTEKMDEFVIRDVQIFTDGVLSRSDILMAARIRAGMNIFTVDLPELQRRIRQHPRIASVELERRMPSSLIIVVHERVPVARIMPAVPTPGGVHLLVDRNGHVMLPFLPGMAPEDVLRAEASLPTLYGIHGAAFAEGIPAAEPKVLSALQFLASYEVSPLHTMTDLLSIDLSQPGDLVVLTSHGSRITFGIRDLDPDFSLQVRNWWAVHQESQRLGRVIGTLDLSVTNNAPLRWLEIPAGSPGNSALRNNRVTQEVPRV